MDSTPLAAAATTPTTHAASADGRVRSVALVTGASVGIGAAFARELARTGHDLVLVSRTRSDLEALAETLRGEGARVEVLPADLSDRHDLRRVADRLAAQGPDAVDLLVNNAGFGLRHAFLDNDVADEELAFDVLCRAVLVLSHAAGRAMRGRGRGAIVNVSSIAGFLTMGTYSASKAWVTTFSEGLSNDLAPHGVGVTALCPGLTRSQFHERSGIAAPVPDALWLDADRLVRDCLRDVRRGRVVSVPGAPYRLLSVLAPRLPRAFGRGASRWAGVRRTR